MAQNITAIFQNTTSFDEEVEKYLPAKSAIESTHTPKGSCRLVVAAGAYSQFKFFDYDIIVIDERNSFYHLRHVVTTLYQGQKPIGFCDMTTPFLMADYHISCFGARGERLYKHQSILHRDTDGIPAKDLRLGANNQGRQGYLIDKKFIDHPITQALPLLNKTILDLYNLHELNWRRRFTNFNNSNQSTTNLKFASPNYF